MLYIQVGPSDKCISERVNYFKMCLPVGQVHFFDEFRVLFRLHSFVFTNFCIYLFSTAIPPNYQPTYSQFCDIFEYYLRHQASRRSTSYVSVYTFNATTAITTKYVVDLLTRISSHRNETGRNESCPRV